MSILTAVLCIPLLAAAEEKKVVIQATIYRAHADRGLVVVVIDGQRRYTRVSVNRKTELTVDGKKVKVNDLRRGMAAEIVVVGRGAGLLHAGAIRAVNEEAAKAAKQAKDEAARKVKEATRKIKEAARKERLEQERVAKTLAKAEWKVGQEETFPQSKRLIIEAVQVVGPDEAIVEAFWMVPKPSPPTSAPPSTRAARSGSAEALDRIRQFRESVRGQKLGPFNTKGPSSLYWLKGFSTTGVADGKPFPLKGRFKVSGTKTYKTISGGTRTVFLLEPVKQK